MSDQHADEVRGYEPTTKQADEPSLVEQGMAFLNRLFTPEAPTPAELAEGTLEELPAPPPTPAAEEEADAVPWPGKPSMPEKLGHFEPVPDEGISRRIAITNTGKTILAENPHRRGAIVVNTGTVPVDIAVDSMAKEAEYGGPICFRLPVGAHVVITGTYAVRGYAESAATNGQVDTLSEFATRITT